MKASVRLRRIRALSERHPLLFAVAATVVGSAVVALGVAVSSSAASPDSSSITRPGGSGETAEVVVAGHLQMVGGPAPGAPRHASGTVTFISPTGTVFQTETQDGSWQVRVPPGAYRVTASQTRQPSWRTVTGGTLYGSVLQASPIRLVVEPDHPVSGVVLTYNVR